MCRWGLSSSLRHLRLACRAHRLEDGRLRLATDALHQSLLIGIPGVLEVPPCFHGADDWALLVAQGVIDGAIVSSLRVARSQVHEPRRQNCHQGGPENWSHPPGTQLISRRSCRRRGQHQLLRSSSIQPEPSR